MRARCSAGSKELGGNFVRLAHYPHNETMVREADRLGLLVWSEIPVYWTIDWSDPRPLANARQQLAEMIGRDRNRAAVILWSVANETPISEPRNAFLRTLIDDARARSTRRASDRRAPGAQRGATRTSSTIPSASSSTSWATTSTSAGTTGPRRSATA